ncbi:hypothetical protein [Streptomyces sp. NPDC004726]
MTSHVGCPKSFNVRSSRPMSFSTVTGLNRRARQEATKASTHRSWNCHGSQATGTSGNVRPSITRRRDSTIWHTFLAPDE